jgi:hypothetical protein
MKIVEWIAARCGGSNSYESIKVGCKSNAEATVTIRTNTQEIANSNDKQEMFGYMLGKWIVKRSSAYFCKGLYVALKEGMA